MIRSDRELLAVMGRAKTAFQLAELTGRPLSTIRQALIRLEGGKHATRGKMMARSPSGRWAATYRAATRPDGDRKAGRL